MHVDAKLKVDITSDGGKSYVANQRIEDRNIRLDTGPIISP